MMSASGTETSGPLYSPEPMDLCPDQCFRDRPFAPHAAHHAAMVPCCPDHRGNVIPNRIFVGGIDYSTDENDLWRYFSEYGRVREVKILTDRSGLPKGYGFISFETREDVQKILQNADRVQFNDKFFYIGPAIRKQHRRGRTTGFSERRSSEGRTRSHNPSTPLPVPPLPEPNGPVYLTTPDGLPYTYHNGVAYFQRPEDIQSAHYWPSSSGTHHAYPPVILSPPPQPTHQQPAYQHYQYMQEYLQRSVYLYQDVDQPSASGGWVHPTLPAISEFMMSASGTSPGPQGASGGWVHPTLPAISEEQTFQVVYQGFHPLPRMKPRRGRRHSHYNSARLTYIPEVSEPEEPSKPPVTQAVE